MLGPRHRVIIAGVAIATAIAIPTAALASGPGSPSSKPSPSAVSGGGAGKSSAASSQLSALAVAAGISVSRLEAGLVVLKQAGGNTAAGVAAFAASTGVSQATAQRVADAVTGR